MKFKFENVEIILIIVFLFLIYFSSTTFSVKSANDGSIASAIESVVERGTLKIDESTFVFTIDKALVNGHFYSDKSPPFIFIGSAVYLFLNKILNLNFTDSEVIMYSDGNEILLKPEKNLFVIENFGQEKFYKKIFNNATLIYNSEKEETLNLIIPFLATPQSQVKKLYISLNGKPISELEIIKSDSLINYSISGANILKGRNVFEFQSNECGDIKDGYPCDLHFFVKPIKYNAYFWLTLFTTVMFTIFLLLFFYKSLKYFKIETYYKVLLTFSLGFGSLLLPYATVLSAHSFTALMTFLGFYYILKFKFEKQKKKYIFLSSLFISIGAFSEIYILPLVIFFLVYTFYIGNQKRFFSLLSIITFFILLLFLFIIEDIFKLFFQYNFIPILLIFVFILFLIYTFKIRKKNPYPFIFMIPFLIVFSIFISYNVLTFQKLLPVYFYTEQFYHYPNSFWLNPTGFNAYDTLATREPRTIYAFNILFGHHGIFLMMPLLFLALYYLITLSFKKNDFQIETKIILYSLIIILTLFILDTTNYSGTSYAFRWFLPLIPVIYYFLGFYFKKINNIKLLLFIFLLSISFYMAIVGSNNVWIPLPETNNIIWDFYYNIFLKNIGLIYSKP
jgi:hypothetical protein